MTENIRDIVDLSSISSLMDSLREATGIPVSLLDENGELLVSSGWQNVCAVYHRQHLKTLERCRENDRFFATYLQHNPAPEGGYVRHTCRNGLIEIGVPIVIEGIQYATLMFGQFLPDSPDMELLKRNAADCGLEEKTYLDAIASVPRFDQDVVDKLLFVYAGIVELLIRLGRTHLEESRTRQELERSEETFRELFDNSADAIYIVSDQGVILEVNKAACERQGYTRDEFRGMRVSSLDDPQFAAGADKRVRRFAAGEQFIFESAHLHKDGTSIPVEISGRRINFGGRKAIMAIARDLRERMDAIDALKRSESKFRSIINSSPMGIYLYYADPEGRLIFTGANPAADQILKIEHEPLIGKVIEDAFPALVGTGIPERFRAICEKGGLWKSEQVDYEDERISGAFEVYAFQTAPRTMAVFFLDITQRKIADQTLRESEEKYRLLFSAEKDAIIIFNTSDLLITEMNQAALDMYGYTRDEFLRMKALGLTAEPEASNERIKAVLEGRLSMMVARHIKKDGTEFPVEITAGTFEWQNRMMLVAIIRDISERERITRMKDEMLSAISHEMRTPLTAILGFTELLLYEDVSPDKARQFLKLSYQEGERLRELIDDLLDLQRLRAGFIGHHFAPIKLEPILHEVASVYAETDRDHDIRVVCRESLPVIIADEQKLHRALKNLMSNAVKYSPDGGPITLKARHLPDKDLVSIAVIDKGLGIPPEAHDQLFDRFFRVYHPEVKNISGTGLGLALVMEIVKLHGGSIRVRSAPGKGSTFTVELPVGGPAEQAEFFGQD